MSSFEIGSILWVKCGSLHWPAQIVDAATLDADVQESLAEEKKQPEIVLKFFNEDGYEFIHDLKTVFPYNGPRKEEFIKKGLVKSRSKIKEGATSGWFAKFPKDIVLCEEILNGDVHILEKEPFVEKNDRPNYRAIFGSKEEGSPKKKAPTPSSGGGRGRKRKALDATPSTPSAPPPKRAIVHPRFKGGKSDHNVKILTQPSSPYHMDLIKSPGSEGGTPTSTNANKYNCQICGFSASRLNVIILHNKTHSDTSGTPASPPKAVKPTPKTSPSVTASSLASVKSLLTPIIPPKGKPGRPKGSGKKKTVIAATTAVDTPPTPKARGRGRPPHAKRVEEPNVKPAIVKTPPKAASPLKKSRLTKKEKEELAKEEARKKEERDKILGDWDDEEEEEEKKVVPEKTRMRDLMEPFVDSSEEEEEEEGFMGDDNVHGNSYEGEEEQDKKDREIEEARLKKEKDEREKIEAIKTKSDDQIDESKKNGDHNGSTDMSSHTSLPKPVPKGDDELLAMDIGKVLEETAVPDVPSVDVEKVKKRKSVSFGATKEFANTKIALVQPESNLDDPMMIDDEFDEFVSSADIAMPSPPKVYQAKKILKRGVETNPLPIPSVVQSSELAVSKADVNAAAPATNGASANNGLQGTPKVDEVDQSKVDSGIDAKKSVPLPEPSNTEDPPKSQDSSSTAPEPEKSAAESRGKGALHPVPHTLAEEQNVDKSPQVETTDLPAVHEPSAEEQKPTQPDSNSQDSASLSNGTSLKSQSEGLVTVSLSNETNTVSAVQMVMTTSDIISENGPADTTHVSQIPSPSVMATTSAINVMTTVGGETASVVTSGEDTYLILVDDGSGAVDSLNSQTLYIDPSQLENGNMVLMTNEGVPVSAQGVSVASSNSNNHPHEILAALNTQQLQLQHQQEQHQQQQQQQSPKTPVLGSGVKLGLVETTPSPTARPVMSPAEIPSNSVALSNNTPVISEQQQQQQVLLAGPVTQDHVIP